MGKLQEKGIEPVHAITTKPNPFHSLAAPLYPLLPTLPALFCLFCWITCSGSLQESRSHRMKGACLPADIPSASYRLHCWSMLYNTFTADSPGGICVLPALKPIGGCQTHIHVFNGFIPMQINANPNIHLSTKLSKIKLGKIIWGHFWRPRVKCITMLKGNNKMYTSASFLATLLWVVVEAAAFEALPIFLVTRSCQLPFFKARMHSRKMLHYHMQHTIV